MIFPLLISSFLDAWSSHWLPITLLAVLTVVIFYNAFLMIARAFGLRDLEREAKSELLQAAATALMAIFLIGIINGAMTFSSGLITGDLACGESPMPIHSVDDAIDAIRICSIQEKAKQIAAVQDNICTGAKTWALFTGLNLDLGAFGITFFKGNWIGSLYEKAESTRIVNNLATSLLVSLNAQSYLLLYIKANMLNIFLPLGIILRSFKFTRGPGAIFIGLAVGLYFIFPVIFVLLDPGFVPTTLPPSPPPSPNQYCYPTMGFATTIFNTMEVSGAATGMSALSMSNLANALSRTYVSLIIHPLVSLFITLIFVRYIVAILGGDTAALMKMVTKVI